MRASRTWRLPKQALYTDLHLSEDEMADMEAGKDDAKPTPRFVGEDVEVVVIILNLNAAGLTVDCISSVLESEKIRLRVIVLDNGSTDGSAEIIAERFHDAIDLLVLPENHGVSYGWNHAIKAAAQRYKPRFYFLLNNDTRTNPSVIRELVQYAERNPGAGILGPTVVDFRPPFEVQDLRHKGLREPTVDFKLQGSALLVRAEVFQDVGLFDEDYFAYGEEHDLLERMRTSRWRPVYVPTSGKVYHLGAATSSRISAFEAYHRTRGGLLLAGKNMDGARLFLCLAAFFCRWLPTWVLSDLRSGRRLENLRARMAGLGSGMRGYFSARASRRKLR